jgi:hypothetical protein
MKNSRNRGQGLTEFAIILPIFMLIVLGIFDLGRVIFYYSTIHNAAREGARYGAIKHCDTTGIINRAREFSIGLGDAVTVTPIVDLSPPPDSYPEQIVVTVEYNFSTVTPFVGIFLGGGSIDLSSQARQHIEDPSNCGP